MINMSTKEYNALIDEKDRLTKENAELKSEHEKLTSSKKCYYDLFIENEAAREYYSKELRNLQLYLEAKIHKSKNRSDSYKSLVIFKVEELVKALEGDFQILNGHSKRNK